MSQSTKTYEGMFLVPPGSDVQAACEPIRTVLSRSEAEIMSIKAWDERRLAYEILGQRRGLYILTYFKADPAKIAEIEHDSQLNEGIMRMLITRKDALGDDEVNAETPAGSRAAAQAAIDAAAPPAEDAKPPAEGAEAPAERAAETVADDASVQTPAETAEAVADEALAEAPAEAEAADEAPAEAVEAAEPEAPVEQAETPEAGDDEPQADN